MTTRSKSLVVARKTLRDFSSVKLLIAYFVSFSLLSLLFAGGMTSTDQDALATLPLATQEQLLTSAFAQLTFIWAAGLPLMAFVGILTANGVARSEQQGTVRILLSKPILRRQVLLGKYLAVVVFGSLTALAGVLIAGSTVYAVSGASVAALDGSIVPYLLPSLAYAFVVVTFVASVGTGVAVLTGSRLKTALATLLVPTTFYGFMFGRIITRGGTYEQFQLYWVDVNYHFGNLFTTVYDAFGMSFSPITHSQLGPITGVYDASNWGQDPLVGGFTGSVPEVGYVPAIASVAVLLALAVVVLVGSVSWFGTKDIS